MYPGSIYSVQSSLLSAEGYGGASCLGSEVGSIASFLLGGPGSEVIFVEGYLLVFFRDIVDVQVDSCPPYHWINKGCISVGTMP